MVAEAVQQPQVVTVRKDHTVVLVVMAPQHNLQVAVKPNLAEEAVVAITLKVVAEEDPAAEVMVEQLALDKQVVVVLTKAAEEAAAVVTTVTQMTQILLVKVVQAM